MDFLGNVNMFRGRVEAGKAVVPGLQLAFPDYHDEVEGRDASVFVRPHEMMIARDRNGDASLAAKILHVNPTGSMVKIQLRAIDFDAVINAEMPVERFAELALALGETVHVSPRRVRVFAEPSGAQAVGRGSDGSRLTPVPRSTPVPGSEH